MASSYERSKLLHVLSYIAVIAVGIALALGWLFGKMEWGDATLVGALQTIASVLAYFVVACYSFNYARVKGVWWVVAWAAAVVLIIVFTIL